MLEIQKLKLKNKNKQKHRKRGCLKVALSNRKRVLGENFTVKLKRIISESSCDFPPKQRIYDAKIIEI